MYRTLSLAVAASALATVASAQSTYIAQNGLLAIPMENSGAPGAWNLSTSTPGFAGDGYIEWEGPNYFNQPGVAGVFGFTFEVQEAGEWIMRIRNRHEDPDPTEENDVWARMDGGPWIKTFSNAQTSVGAWTWESTFELGHGNFPQASYSLSTGVHRIEFSGRSNGFKMDRLHLHRPGNPNAFNPNSPNSPRRVGSEYGSANTNSTGQVSIASALGSPRAQDNDLTLQARGLPVNVPGYFIASRTSGFVSRPGSSAGNLLLGGTIGRLIESMSMTDGSGRASSRLNLQAIPMPDNTVAASAGQTWYVQFWHRDTSSNGSTSNFSRGLEITFQ